MLARRIILQTHRWSGILLALYILTIGLSGAILMFSDELHKLLYPDLRFASGRAGPRVGIDCVAHNIANSYRGARLLFVFAPTEKVHAFETFVVQGDRDRRIFSDPTTGLTISEIDDSRSPIHWLEDLHKDLLLGGAGRRLNGVGGMLLILLCATGIVIWWPGVKKWRSGLSVDFARRWKRVTWDLHRSVGFWSVAMLAMWGGTGVYFGFTEETKAVINWFSPVSKNNVTGRSQQPRDGRSRPDLDLILDRARRTAPNTSLLGIAFPSNNRKPYTVYLARERMVDRRSAIRTADYVYVDQHTGEVLGKFQRGINHTAGDAIVWWMMPLHFGDFGGSAVKLIWAVLGITPGILAITGMLMYWNRYLSKRWSNWFGANVREGRARTNT